jgi:ribosomal protein S18 acetylase RimI-like enzyme
VDELERMAAALPLFWRSRVSACDGIVHEVDGLAVCLTGVADEPFNPTLVERTPSDPAAALAAAAERYRPTGLSLGIDLEPTVHKDVRTAAERSGMRMIESRPGMALRIADLRSSPAPADVEIRWVEDVRLLAQVADADAAAFDADAGLTRAFLPDAVLDDSAQRVFAALIDGHVVGTGESALADGVLGVFGIATVPAFRRRGIAGALTSALIADRAEDADLAVLQSSRLGLGVYERLGFRRMSTWEVWVQPDPVAHGYRNSV